MAQYSQRTQPMHSSATNIRRQSKSSLYDDLATSRRFVPKVDEAIRSLERDATRGGCREWREWRDATWRSRAGRDAGVARASQLLAERGILASCTDNITISRQKMIDIERLIEFVKTNEFLYNISHKDYKNPSLKNATWEFIAKELNGTSEICRLKWKTVRDSYIKNKRMLKNSDGTKDFDYIWSANLKFLDDFNVNRRSFYNTVGKRISTSPPPLAPLGSLSMAEVSTASFQTNQDLRINMEDSKTKFKEIDATDLLFLSYSGTFKKFPARKQTLMKLELAKLFANAELQQLDDAEQSGVEAAESFPVIIKTEYTEKGESELSGSFSDDIMEMNPAKRKRRSTKTQK